MFIWGNIKINFSGILAQRLNFLIYTMRHIRNKNSITRIMEYRYERFHIDKNRELKKANAEKMFRFNLLGS
jgi:hypothetical protein